MKNRLLCVCVVMMAMAIFALGQSAPPPAIQPGGDDVMAVVGDQKITFDELRQTLLDTDGPNVLLLVVQLDLARQMGRTNNITVTPRDIDAEVKMVIAGVRANSQEYDQNGAAAPTTQAADEEADRRLLDEVLRQKQVSHSEFHIIMETNAYLRKVVAPQVDKLITEEMIRQRFDAQYGEKVEIRFIETEGLPQIGPVQHDLAAGMDFALVARTHSIDRFATQTGGLLEPFGRATTAYPDLFKQTAFSLTDGQVSDPVMIGTHYFILKMIRHIEPMIVKYEDYRDIVRKGLYDDAVTAAMGQLRQSNLAYTLKELKITDPTLKKAYEDRQAQQQSAAMTPVENNSDIRQKWDKERARILSTQPGATTQPATTQP